MPQNIIFTAQKKKEKKEGIAVLVSVYLIFLMGSLVPIRCDLNLSTVVLGR